jgi:CRP/FNR family cyclic AMP-dependent transcriptional regulator
MGDPHREALMHPQDDDSPAAVLAYCADLPEVQFDDGAVLLSEGPGSDLLYFLVEGTLEVLRGETQVALIGEPGAVFGEISALLGHGHSATVRAAGPVTVRKAPGARAFLKERPEVLYHLSKGLAQRLVDVTTYLADIKNQYADRGDHLSMVHEVLDSLVTQSPRRAVADVEVRTDDPRL